MNERPTPETDARKELITMDCEDSVCGFYVYRDGAEYTGDLVDVEFARRLERERDEARDFAQKITDKALSATGDLQRQLAEAREQIAAMREAIKTLVDLCERAMTVIQSDYPDTADMDDFVTDFDCTRQELQPYLK